LEIFLGYQIEEGRRNSQAKGDGSKLLRSLGKRDLGAFSN